MMRLPKSKKGKEKARKEKKGEKKQGGKEKGKKKGKEAQSFGGTTDAVAEGLGLLGGATV